MKSFPEVVCVMATLWLVLEVLLAGKGLTARAAKKGKLKYRAHFISSNSSAKLFC